jgi:hypothetical protein
MDQIKEKKPLPISFIGIFLILIGAGLLLQRTHILPHRWSTVLWGAFGILGLIAVVHAFLERSRGKVFWGSLLFFVSTAVLVHRYSLLEFEPWDVPATISLAVGLSFLMLFLFDPRHIGVLVPLIFFGGYGVLYYLWWWDIINWFDMKYYIRTYWPTLIILWGLSLLVQRRKKVG